MDRRGRRLLGIGLAVFGTALEFVSIQVADREIDREFEAVQEVQRHAIEDALWNRDHPGRTTGRGVHVPHCDTVMIPELLGGLTIVAGALVFVAKARDKKAGTRVRDESVKCSV